MLVLFGRLDSLQVANGGEPGTGNPSGTLLGPVKQPEVQRVHADLLADLVYNRLGCEGRGRGARRPVGLRSSVLLDTTS